MSSDAKPRFKVNWLKWTVDRQERTFRVYVVEPRDYSPKDHANIFEAALRHFMPQPSIKSEGSSDATEPTLAPTSVKQFDLLTFPEAFLDSATLVKCLQKEDPTKLLHGCVHAGLRPPGSNEVKATHLFSKAQIEELVKELETIPSLYTQDLQIFSSWLEDQGAEDYFNLACLFAIDPGESVYAFVSTQSWCTRQSNKMSCRSTT
jgi:hypothetical protein